LHFAALFEILPGIALQELEALRDVGNIMFILVKERREGFLCL
jgi:hypothetical protein